MLNGQLHFRQTIVAAVVALIMLAAAVALGGLIVGFDARSTPIITTILGMIAPTVVALLALLNSERVDHKVNGHLGRLTDAALEAHAEVAVAAERERQAAGPQ